MLLTFALSCHFLFQGFKCYQPHTARCGRSPECKEAAEKLEKVDVLRHHPSPGNSGYHRGRGYPAMEEISNFWARPETQHLGAAEYIYCFSVLRNLYSSGTDSHSSFSLYRHVQLDKPTFFLPICWRLLLFFLFLFWVEACWYLFVFRSCAPTRGEMTEICIHPSLFLKWTCTILAQLMNVFAVCWRI